MERPPRSSPPRSRHRDQAGEQGEAGAPGVPRGTPAELLASGLEELGQEARPGLIESLARLAELVARWSSRVNLTSHRGPDEVARHLVLDAVALSAALPPGGSIADLGSGAGFPGFPLALLDPERPVTLVEARERAHHFQRTVIRELGLPNVRALRGRIEELDPEPHAGVVAQAMGPPAEVLSAMVGWAEPGGWLAIPYSQHPPEIPLPAGVEALDPGAYRVPLAGPLRSVWLGRRAL